MLRPSARAVAPTLLRASQLHVHTEADSEHNDRDGSTTFAFVIDLFKCHFWIGNKSPTPGISEVSHGLFVSIASIATVHRGGHSEIGEHFKVLEINTPSLF